MPISTGLSGMQDLPMEMAKFECRNIFSCFRSAMFMEPQMRHVRVIPHKAEYGPKVEGNMSPKRDNHGLNKTKWNFDSGAEAMNMHMTNRTPKDDFKKRDTYLYGKLTLFK
jgi:hypothetical protein